MRFARIGFEGFDDRRVRRQADQVVGKPSHLASRCGVTGWVKIGLFQGTIDEAIDVGSDESLTLGCDHRRSRITDGFP